MRADININTNELAKEIARNVIKDIKPLLPSSSKEDEMLFTVESLAKYLAVSKQWVYERVSLNEIPFYKIGKFPRFKKSDIDRWLESHKVPAVNPISKRLKVVK